jgi:hypothetical protein
MTAVRESGLWLYPELAAIVSRQNGKTTLLLPRILMELKNKGRILHTAQDRVMPRLTWEELADRISSNKELRDMLAPRGIRSANGTESIKFKNGGRYTLLAPSHGIRGYTGDLVIQDEVREQVDDRLKRAMGPTTIASPNPQKVYLSNAGHEDSVVLNELRRRGLDESEERLAYLEWSAAPDRPIHDRQGWAEANPALNYGIVPLTTTDLEDALASQSPAGFETEHLCRWVISMQRRLLTDEEWARCRGELEKSVRPHMGVSMDPSGQRASAVIAWQQTNGMIGCRVIADVTGNPIDVDAFGEDLFRLSLKLGVSDVGFDSLTDAALAKHFKAAKPIGDREYANATARFVTVVAEGRLRWDEADEITQDLPWVGRRNYEGSSGAYRAVKQKEERPATAMFAAIRAVFLASGPKTSIPKGM